MIKVYSRNNCPWCEKAKELLDSLGLEYKVYHLGTDFVRQELQEMLPPGRALTVPQIWVHGTYVGGYTDLAEYAEQHGMMGLQS